MRPGNPELVQGIADCERCPLADLRHRTAAKETRDGGPLTVPAEIGDDYDGGLAILGQAPGSAEGNTGRPFVGPAGRILGELLYDAGLERSQVLLLNRVRCRPPKNRIASKEGRAALVACEPWLEAELAEYNPRVVVAMGKEALQVVFGTTVTVRKTRGKRRATGPDFHLGERVWVATYHPASLVPSRSPQNYGLVVRDLILAKEEWQRWRN